MNISSNIVSMSGSNFAVRDAILEMGMMSPVFSIAKGLCGQEDLKNMLEHCSPNLIAALNNCTVETYNTSLIDHVAWPEGEDLITFASKDYMIDQATLQAHIESVSKGSGCLCCRKKPDLAVYPVKVRMINIDWFHNEEKLFTDFAKIVEDKPDDLYDTEFVKYMLTQNWDPIRSSIVKFRVLPHISLSCMVSWYFYAALKYDSVEIAFEKDQGKVHVLTYICFALLLYNFALEMVQLYYMRLAYFNIWNLFDLTSLASSIFVTFKIYTSSNWFSIESLRVIAAIASSNLIFKLYDWMRLWTGTAFLHAAA